MILKADDLHHHWGDPDCLHPYWIRFFALLREREITASTGLIGNSLESGTEGYKQALRSLIAEGRIEVWNHGYTHSLDGVDPAWDARTEFCGTSPEFQYGHLRKTQQLIRDELGVVSAAFGAPGNLWDENTQKALARIPEIRLWFRGSRPYPGQILSTNLRAEDSNLDPSLESFEESYALRGSQPVLFMQVHPGSWETPANLAVFGEILDRLEARGARFITISQYLSQVADDEPEPEPRQGE